MEIIKSRLRESRMPEIF